MCVAQMTHVFTFVSSSKVNETLPNEIESTSTETENNHPFLKKKIFVHNSVDLL